MYRILCGVSISRSWLKLLYSVDSSFSTDRRRYILSSFMGQFRLNLLQLFSSADHFQNHIFYSAYKIVQKVKDLHLSIYIYRSWNNLATIRKVLLFLWVNTSRALLRSPILVGPFSAPMWPLAPTRSYRSLRDTKQLFRCIFSLQDSIHNIKTSFSC